MCLRNLIIAVLVAASISEEPLLSAQTDEERSDSSISISLNLRPSYVMPTHGFYNGWNPSQKAIRTGGTADVQFGISDGYRGVYQGLGAAVHTFFADDLVGTPATMYVFQGAPLLSVTESLAFGYEWNLGLSCGWKDNGAAVVSPFNVYINVAALFTWRMNGYWDLTFGPEYTHFSNGDTKFPNGGANTVNFRIGTRRRFQSGQTISVEPIFAGDSGRSGFAERFSYDLTALGGWRADRTIDQDGLHIFNKAFPTAALIFNPLYSFNDYLSAGPALDLLYDRSADLIITGQGSSYEYPSFFRQISAGLSARAELKMPVFAVNIGIGYSLPLTDHTRSSDLKALYGIFSLKAFMTERLFLNVTYRLSSVLYSHNLLFGVGWRLGEV